MAYVRVGRRKQADLCAFEQIIPTSFLEGPLTSANPYVICHLSSQHVVTGCGQGLHLGLVLINEELTAVPCVTWLRLSPRSASMEMQWGCWWV